MARYISMDEAGCGEDEWFGRRRTAGGVGRRDMPDVNGLEVPTDLGGIIIEEM